MNWLDWVGKGSSKVIFCSIKPPLALSNISYKKFLLVQLRPRVMLKCCFFVIDSCSQSSRVLCIFSFHIMYTYSTFTNSLFCINKYFSNHTHNIKIKNPWLKQWLGDAQQGFKRMISEFINKSFMVRARATENIKLKHFMLTISLQLKKYFHYPPNKIAKSYLFVP